MEAYINQLLEDLENAKSNTPDKPNVHVLYPDHPALEYGLDYIAEWECAPQTTMATLMGIPHEALPPVEKLTEKQAKLLSDKILELWAAFNFYADFPDGLPDLIKYKIIKEKWGENVQYISEGMTHFEFCHYEPSECPFGLDYCSCKDIPDFYMDPKIPENEDEQPF